MQTLNAELNLPVEHQRAENGKSRMSFDQLTMLMSCYYLASHIDEENDLENN